MDGNWSSAAIGIGTFVGGVASGVLGTYFSQFFSHSFTLQRERRKEFNEVADKLDAELRKFEEKLSPYTNPPGVDDFEIVRRRMRWYEAWCFSEAIRDFLLEVQRADNTTVEFECEGAFFDAYDDTEKLKKSLATLRQFLKRK